MWIFAIAIVLVAFYMWLLWIYNEAGKRRRLRARQARELAKQQREDQLEAQGLPKLSELERWWEHKPRQKVFREDEH